jgi:hypothetical protein
MKKLLAASAIFFLLSIPLISYAQPGQNVQKAPPISSGLVREGNFAIKLVEVLKLGTAKNETEAENMLAAAGISPKNGWIADHPLTPDIIGEVRRAIAVALDSGTLAMKKDEASLAVQVLIDSQWKLPAASGGEEAREYGDYPSSPYEEYDPYYNPDLYPFPYYPPYYDYYYPYPYYYYGYYYPYPYFYFRSGFGFRGFRGHGFGFRGFRGGGRGGRR